MPTPAKHKLRLKAPLFVGLAILSTVGHAQPVLRVCEEADWPPYTYEQEGHPSTGIALDVMQALSDKLNWQLDMQLYPFKRCLKMMRSGERDAISVITDTPEREQYLRFSQPFVFTHGVFYYSKKLGTVNWQTPEDLQQLRVVVVAGHNLGKAFNTAINSGSLAVQKVKLSAQGFELITRDRADVFLLHKATGDEMLQGNPAWQQHIRASAQHYHTYRFKLGLSKKSKLVEQMPAINKAIQQLHKSGRVAQIQAKYSAKSYAETSY